MQHEYKTIQEVTLYRNVTRSVTSLTLSSTKIESFCNLGKIPLSHASKCSAFTSSHWNPFLTETLTAPHLRSLPCYQCGKI
jgi:hypothetical protein